MSASLPPPVDLPLPEGRPAELAGLVNALAGAAFHAGVLDAHLTGPAASAPGWLGADSAAAAEQVGRTATLTREVCDALTTAWHRLDAHHQLLVTAVARIRAMRAEQDDDFAHAQARVDALERQDGSYGDPGSEVAVLEELRAADHRRAQRHAQVLDEVARDATDTARVLAGSCRAVGGTGSPGDRTRVFVHLAAELPGWGEGELEALGTGLAERIERPITRGTLDELARDALPYAATPAFARALLTGLGRQGVAYLLTVLGTELEQAPGPLAALLARALGAAWPSHAELPPDADPLTDVFEGHYVDAGSRDSTADAVVLGMGQVLLAGGPEMPSATVALWGRQMLARERAQELQGDDLPMHPPGRDPVVLVLERLGEAGDAEAAASLLSSRGSWEALLHRAWDDGGAALSAVVASAVTGRAPAGGTALAAGLAAMGTGLSPGSAETWTVNRETVARLAPGLGLALASHVDVVTALLASGLPSHQPDATQDSALRGLGYLTIDERAARTIAAALATWAASPPGTSSPGPLDAAPGLAIGSFVAVRQYGQRLAYALHGAEEMYRAVDRQFSWNMTVGLVVGLTPGPVGEVAGLLEGPAARRLHADGTWQAGRDLGMVLNRDDAAATAAAVAWVHGGSAVPDVMDQARAGFDRTTAVLGTPRPPDSPGQSALDELPGPQAPPDVDHELPRFGRGGR